MSPVQFIDWQLKNLKEQNWERKYLCLDFVKLMPLVDNAELMDQGPN